ncbi:hypothetical protein E2N92_11055 [Methanofollis formosanus]|uniref:Uncharacterized protein n=1 Tax=Methanofollis formosanus TaxID=299308 RepID=A0A8G1EHE8_9EURY|nr:hypothetical protein [Methanofollis formosanus]QYZ79922.1 hypothetical protein E2N92_11055 [Methanofollis formosanus]
MESWILVFIIIGILVVLPWILNISMHYLMKRKILKNLRLEDLPEDERITVVQELLSQPPSRKGLSRYSMMLAVVLIVGAAVLYLAEKDICSDLLKNTLGVLTGALATIVGFYFGGRAEEIKAEEVEKLAKEIHPEKKDGGHSPPPE